MEALASVVLLHTMIDHTQVNQRDNLPVAALYCDTLDQVTPDDYDYLHRNLPSLVVYDKPPPSPYPVNVIVTESYEFLQRFVRETGFFNQQYIYAVISTMGERLLGNYLLQLWTEFNIFQSIVIDYSTKEVSMFDLRENRTVRTSTSSDTWAKAMALSLSDFHGGPMRVVYFPREQSFTLDDSNVTFSGQDANAMAVLAEQMNATLQLVISSDGKTYGRRGPNGTVEGAFIELLEGNAIITGNVHFMKYYAVPGITFTQHIATDRLCLMVPIGKQLSVYAALLMKIRYDLLFSFLVSCNVGLLIVRRTAMYFKTRSDQRQFSLGTSTEIVIRIFLAVPNVYPCLRTHQRIVVGSFLLGALVISNYFQGTLTTIASDPVEEKQMNTFEDVMDSGVEILFSNGDVKSLINDGGDLKGLNFKLVTVEESIAEGTKGNKGRTHRLNVAFARNNIRYRGTKESKSMQIPNECLVTYPLAFVVLSTCIYMKHFNRILSTLFESGLYRKWVIDSVPAGVYRIEKPVSPDDNVVSNEKLSFSYGILFVGLSASLLVFVAEKLVHTSEVPGASLNYKDPKFFEKSSPQPAYGIPID